MFVSLIVVMASVACVVAIFYLKSYLVETDALSEELNSIVPAVINAIQITIFNMIYDSLKDKLNDFENHKIISSYENSLILKVFLFQFFNTFLSCIFIAFFEQTYPFN